MSDISLGPGIRIRITVEGGGDVRTVNGVRPDAQGNVQVEIPEGFSGSWNDLTEKPFYDKNVTLAAWDGKTEGLTRIGTGMNYHVYGPFPADGLAAQDFVGAVVPTHTEGDYVLTEDDITEDGLGIYYSYGGMNNCVFAFVGEGGSLTITGASEILTPGIWMWAYGGSGSTQYGEGSYCDKIVRHTLKLIDEKFIPEELPSDRSAFQQLATDADGNVQWEDKTHYAFDEVYISGYASDPGLDRIPTNMYPIGLYGPFAFDGMITDLIGATVKYDYKEVVITSEHIKNDGAAIVVSMSSDLAFVLTTADNMTVTGDNTAGTNSVTVPSAGAWFCSSTGKTICQVFRRHIKPISEEYFPTTVPVIPTATAGQTIVVKAVDDTGKPTEWEAVESMVVASSTEGSTKKFKITVDDTGTLSAVEVTE